jgi:hypothetical protein
MGLTGQRYALVNNFKGKASATLCFFLRTY